MYKFIILSLLLFSTCFGLEQLISDSLETMSAEITAAPTDSTSGDSCVILKNGVVTIVPKDIFADSLNISVDSVTHAVYSDTADYSKNMVIATEWDTTVFPGNGKPLMFFDMTYGDGRFVAVSAQRDGGTYYDNLIASSPDGINWTVVDSVIDINTKYYGVAYGNARFVAVSKLGLTAVSFDGLNFDTTTSGVFATSICFGKGMFVAGYTQELTIGRIFYSTDGFEWDSTDLPDNSLGVNDVFYGNGLFVAVTYDGTDKTEIYTSPDAITWTERDVPDSTIGVGFAGSKNGCYGNGKYAITAYRAGWTGSYIMHSTDGITWDTTSVDTVRVLGMCYGKGHFVATNFNTNDTILCGVSSDAINWNWIVHEKGKAPYHNVTYGNDVFVISDYSNNLLYSGAQEISNTHFNYRAILADTAQKVKDTDMSPGKVVTTGTDTVLTTPDSAGIDSLTTNNFSIGSGPYITKVDTNATNDTLWHIFGSDTFYMVKKP